MIDMSTLTLAEVAKIEELSGQSITVLGEDERPKGLLTAAMVFVTKRRTDPGFTWNDACGVTFEQANELLGFTTPEAPADQVGDQVTPGPTESPEPTPLPSAGWGTRGPARWPSSSSSSACDPPTTGH
jgi:hypothetical protein